jgi:hypothetical protein
MATCVDIQSKTDEDLLKMYGNQADYLPEIVDWICEESAKRGLPVADIRVSAEAQRSACAEHSERGSSRRFVRLWGVLQIPLGLFSLIFGATELLPYHPEIGMPIGLFFMAHGACLLRPFVWALAVGVALYSLLSMCSLAFFIWSVINLSFANSLLGFLLWVLAGALALAFRHLWKNCGRLVELKEK